MTETLPRHITISPDVLAQRMDDQVVLLNLGNDHYYGLDPVGTRMWELLNERGDAEALVPILLSEFATDEATLRRDLAKLVQDLERAGLLTVA
jgi:hypothetical protein